MKLQDIVEASTKQGQEITFKRYEDIEGKRTNRGWRVDEIKAFVNGEEAGYLKISYIPKEAFKHFYPSIINFVDQINGQPLQPHNKDHIHYSKLSDDELRKMIETGFHYNAKWFLEYDFKSRENKYISNLKDKTEGKFIKDMSRDELLEAVRHLEGLLTEKYKKGKRGFDWFKRFFVDRPMVDFIRVYDDWEQQKRDLSQNYQRQGIGTALYKEGAKWMAERGMKLYGSKNPSDSAKGAWEAMTKAGIVSKDRRGRYVDPEKI